MHYIRFLRTPNVVVDKSDVQLHAVVTVTTDLGETFYPEDLDLVATVEELTSDGDVYLRRKIQWTAGSRSLAVKFNLTRSDVEWPACMHIALKQSETECEFLPAIVEIWSGAINPVKGQFDSGSRVERRFTSLSGRSLSLVEDAGDSIARHLWDGSQALVQYLDQILSLQTSTTSLPLLEYLLVSATYRRLNVLELGCGCGTVGLALAQMVPDCDVTLTDLPEVKELVEANIQRLNPSINSKAVFRALDWEQPLPADLTSKIIDLIVVSECTYNTDTLQPLVNTLSALTKKCPKSVICVSTKTRHPSEAVFFDLMRTSGFMQDSTKRVRLPGLPGSGYADYATDVGLHVFHGKDHRLSLSPRESEQQVPRASRTKQNGEASNRKTRSGATISKS